MNAPLGRFLAEQLMLPFVHMKIVLWLTETPVVARLSVMSMDIYSGRSVACPRRTAPAVPKPATPNIGVTEAKQALNPESDPPPSSCRMFLEPLCGPSRASHAPAPLRETSARVWTSRCVDTHVAMRPYQATLLLRLAPLLASRSSQVTNPRLCTK